MFARTRKRSWVARTTAVAAVAGLLALTGATSAAAKGDDEEAGGISPQAIVPNATGDGAVIGRGGRVVYVNDHTPQGNKADPIVQFYLTFGGTNKQLAYCIDWNHPADKTGNVYNEGSWNDSNVRNLPKIQWILHNSVPNAKAADVLSKAGATVGAGVDQDFVVYVGTQSAIWHYSDGIDLVSNAHKGRPGLSDAEYAAAAKVRQYLIDHAGNGSEPGPDLRIKAPDGTGYVGQKVGPFTVTTNADKVTLKTSDGAKIVDAAGKEISQVGNNGQFWVIPGATGKVTVQASGTVPVPTGRAFIAKNTTKDHQYQKLILAGTGSKSVQATATVTVTTAPSPSASGQGGATLPRTGSSLPVELGIAVLLLAAGSVLLVALRRRRAGAAG